MMDTRFVSARFVRFEDIDGTVTTDRHVVATDNQGREWQHTVDCQEGDWLRYIELGGTIEPYVEPEPQP